MNCFDLKSANITCVVSMSMCYSCVDITETKMAILTQNVVELKSDFRLLCVGGHGRENNDNVKLKVLYYEVLVRIKMYPQNICSLGK